MLEDNVGMPERHSPSGDSCEPAPALAWSSTEVGGRGELCRFVFFPSPILAKRAGQGHFCSDRLLLHAVWHLSRETADCPLWVSEQPHSSNPSKFPGFKCHGHEEVGGNRAHNSQIQTATCSLKSLVVPQPNGKNFGQRNP